MLRGHLQASLPVREIRGDSKLAKGLRRQLTDVSELYTISGFREPHTVGFAEMIEADTQI